MILPLVSIIGGVATVYGASISTDPKMQSIGKLAGGAAIVAGVYYLALDIVEGVSLFGKPKQAVESITETTLPGPINQGAPAATGVIQASIDSPIDGARLQRSGLAGSSYPVVVLLKSSRNVPESLRVTLVSREFYSFGGDEEQVTDLGTIVVKPGEQVRVKGNAQIAATGFLNPFSPPEVVLELKVNGTIRDAVRFSYE